MPGSLTVILADDHAIFLQGLVSLMTKVGGYEIIATASDGEEAYEQIVTRQPTIAILDSAMPCRSGVEIMEDLTKNKEAPNTKFVLLTMFSHPQLLADAMAAGAAACVSKKDAARELGEALTSLGTNRFFVSSSLSGLLAEIEAGQVIGLTKRERQIMNSVVEGRTNKEIANELGIAIKTVDTHRERLMKKIGAHNSADIVRYAMQMGVGMV